MLQFRTKAELVYEHLRQQILTGQLGPGARISISGVARELGVSDIPVREGIKRLESEGLVQFETHKGAVVTQLGPHDIEELFAIRTELEALALRRAAETISAPTLAVLRQLLDAMTVAEGDGDLREYGRLNREFHLTIYEAQPFEKLSAMIRNLWDSTDWCRRIFMRDAGYVMDSSVEHEGIYSALEARDGEKAVFYLRRQKDRAREWLMHHVESDSTIDPAESAELVGPSPSR